MPSAASIDNGAAPSITFHWLHVGRRELVGVVDDDDVPQVGQLAAHLEEPFEEGDVLDDRDPASEWPTRYSTCSGAEEL